nr:MAG TPA: hypothetical protein [Bacteriophage sp.]
MSLTEELKKFMKEFKRSSKCQSIRDVDQEE